MLAPVMSRLARREVDIGARGGLGGEGESPDAFPFGDSRRGKWNRVVLRRWCAGARWRKTTRHHHDWNWTSSAARSFWLGRTRPGWEDILLAEICDDFVD